MSRTTVSLLDDAAPGGPAVGDCLVLAMDAAHPLRRPWRAALTGVDEVVLGRGAQGDAGGFYRRGRVLEVEVPSAAVSSRHARLVRAGDGWMVHDEGSKNGTWVNGERTSRRLLGARDLLELGTALFVLRPGAGDVAAGAWEGRTAGLRTLFAPLERELALLERVAPSRVPILILGETGTGKEVTARAIHRLAGRPGEFAAINCGGVPEALLAGELFGARKGAYTGAHADRVGLVEQAHRGTLFLDEVAELPLAAQAVLLRVVQEREVVALGSTRPVPVDVRMVSATNEDLGERVALRKFRRDLYARLSGITLTLPPLRDRREDLGLLCADLLPRIAERRAAAVTFHRAAARALFAHDWPLNVRELEHALATAIAVADDDEIRLEHLPPALRGGASDPASPREREAFLAVVTEQRGNISAIARALGTSRTHVRRLAERHGIELDKHRG